jgi:hypothetical protein
MRTLTIEIAEPGDEHPGFDVVDEWGRRCNVLSWDEIAVTAPTPTITEAARMALDALTEIDGAVIALLSSLAYRDPGPDSPGEKVRASITALRTALSAPATTRGGWFIDAGQSNIGALWQQVEAGTDGAVWLSSALSADVPALPEPDINTVNHASVRIVGYSSEAARAYGAACRTAAPAGDVQPVAPEQHAAMSRLIELAAECAQRKPLQAFVHLTDATHIGHRQFAAAHSEADDAVRILAIELRKVWDSLRTPAAAPATPAAPSVPPLPDDTIAAALADPACTRLREWAAIGPVQRAAVQSFADRLAAAPSVPAGWVDAVMEQAQVFASAHPQEDRPHG